MGEGFKVSHKLPIFDTNIYLYNEGDENVALTGGWLLEQGMISGYGLMTKYAAYIKGIPQTSSTGSGLCYAKTANKIDLTNIKFIKAEITLESSNGNPATYNTYIEVYSGTTSVALGQLKAITSTRTLVTIDVSALSGLHTIKFGAYSSTGSMYKLWLEK